MLAHSRCVAPRGLALRRAKLSLAFSALVLAFTVLPAVHPASAQTPSAPAAPTVSAVSGSAASLSVSWTEPANTGESAISGYDLRYRQSGATVWTDGPQDETSTSATIGGLAANTTYEVQVRATNSEGDSSWSATGTGTTNDGQPPEPMRSSATVTTASDGTDKMLRITLGFTGQLSSSQVPPGSAFRVSHATILPEHADPSVEIASNDATKLVLTWTAPLSDSAWWTNLYLKGRAFTVWYTAPSSASERLIGANGLAVRNFCCVVLSWEKQTAEFSDAPTTWDNSAPGLMSLTLRFGQPLVNASADRLKRMVTLTNAEHAAHAKISSDGTTVTYRVQPVADPQGRLNRPITASTSGDCMAVGRRVSIFGLTSYARSLCGTEAGVSLRAWASVTIQPTEPLSTARFGQIDSVTMKGAKPASVQGRANGVVEIDFSNDLDPAHIPPHFRFDLTRKYADDGDTEDRGSIRAVSVDLSSDDSSVLVVRFGTHDAPGQSGELFMGAHPTTHAPYDYYVSYSPPARFGDDTLRTPSGWRLPSLGPTAVTRSPLTAALSSTAAPGSTTTFEVVLTLSEPVYTNSYSGLITATNVSTVSGPTPSEGDRVLTYTVELDSDPNTQTTVTAAVPTAQQCAESPSGRLCTVDRRPLSSAVSALVPGGL